MKFLNLIIALVTSLTTVTSAIAQNKVVVIPLEGSVPLRIFYGSVTHDGSLETGNAVSALRYSEGTYYIDAGSSVVGCALTVTKGSQGGGVANIHGNITAHVPSAGTNFRVNTRDSAAILDDTDFHFTAICPR